MRVKVILNVNDAFEQSQKTMKKDYILRGEGRSIVECIHFPGVLMLFFFFLFITYVFFLLWRWKKRKRLKIAPVTDLQSNHYSIYMSGYTHSPRFAFAHTHTHTHIYIYIYIYANFIKHNWHFMPTYFLLDPFEFPYYFYRIRGNWFRYCP